MGVNIYSKKSNCGVLREFICVAVMMFVLTPLWGSANDKSGVVLDGTTGEGLPGVTIRVKGTETGTITDFEGNFSVLVSSGDVLLIFFHWVCFTRSHNRHTNYA